MRVHVTGTRNQRQRLDAAADGDRSAFIGDGVGCVRNGLQARRAETVDGRARCGRWATGPEGGVASDIVTGGAFRLRGAEENILNFCRVDTSALNSALDRVASHCDAVGVIQRAAAGLGHCRAGG